MEIKTEKEEYSLALKATAVGAFSIILSAILVFTYMVLTSTTETSVYGKTTIAVSGFLMGFVFQKPIFGMLQINKSAVNYYIVALESITFIFGTAVFLGLASIFPPLQSLDNISLTASYFISGSVYIFIFRFVFYDLYKKHNDRNKYRSY